MWRLRFLTNCHSRVRIRALTEAGVRVATVDHLISWAMYFDDPDGNGLEIYWDTRNVGTKAKLWRGINMPLGGEEILGVLEGSKA